MTPADLENAKAGDANFIALLEILDREFNKVSQHGCSRLLGHFMLFGQLGSDLGQGNSQNFFFGHGSLLGLWRIVNEN
jgi:hypothetical protein